MSERTQPWGLETDRPVPVRSQRFGHRLFGGPPLAVLIRLLFVSLVVGAVMMWLGIEPLDVLTLLTDAVHRVWAMGFDALGQIGRYLVAGAAIVVPLWIVARLLSLRGPG
jgi:hypothetical protein